MGKATQCAYLTCANDCCNYYGFCPEDYDQATFDKEYTTCYNYYHET